MSKLEHFSTTRFIYQSRNVIKLNRIRLKIGKHQQEKVEHQLRNLLLCVMPVQFWSGLSTTFYFRCSNNFYAYTLFCAFFSDIHSNTRKVLYSYIPLCLYLIVLIIWSDFRIESSFHIYELILSMSRLDQELIKEFQDVYSFGQVLWICSELRTL